MKSEDLFLAIGQVESSRLARSELPLSGSPGAEAKEEIPMHKGRIPAGRVIRSILVAALIASLLAVTAYAVTGYLRKL